MNVSSKKRASSSGKGQWVDWRFPVAPLLTIKNICSIMGENKNATRGCIMKEKEEIKKLIDEIENKEMLVFLLEFIKSAIKLSL
jgi:hypothetical protein